VRVGRMKKEGLPEDDALPVPDQPRLEPGALFEARLVWDGQGVVFGKTFLFHPPDAHQQVLQVVERATARNAPALELLFLLSRLYVRWNRFNHLGAAKIYAAGEA